MIVRLLALGAMLSTSLAAAAVPQPLEPTAKWVVNFDDAQCIASRNYGTKQAPLFLGLKAPALGDVMQIMIVRPGQRGEFANQHPVKISAGGSSFDASMLEVGAADSDEHVYRINLSREQFAAVKGGQQLSIQSGAELDLSFALDGMQPLMKVLDRCVADLRQVWNIPSASGAPATLRQPARGELAPLFNGIDYPEVALDRETGGTVALSILVDEQGRVADCTVIGTSGAAALDSQSCAIVKARAQFRPAIGTDGQPAKSSIVEHVRWEMDDASSRVR